MSDANLIVKPFRLPVQAEGLGGGGGAGASGAVEYLTGGARTITDADAGTFFVCQSIFGPITLNLNISAGKSVTLYRLYESDVTLNIPAGSFWSDGGGPLLSNVVTIVGHVDFLGLGISYFSKVPAAEPFDPSDLQSQISTISNQFNSQFDWDVIDLDFSNVVPGVRSQRLYYMNKDEGGRSLVLYNEIFGLGNQCFIGGLSDATHSSDQTVSISGLSGTKINGVAGGKSFVVGADKWYRLTRIKITEWLLERVTLV